jgi:Cu(I)/Ag(I) efflux system periplasmic protein CusF
MKRLLAISATAAVLAAVSSFAIAQSGEMKGMDMKDQKGMEMQGKDEQGKAGKKSQSKSHHAVGIVKSLDAGKGTLTVDHQAVQSMNWPAMTMTFKAKDKKMLETLAAGKKIEFDFVQQGKDYVVTSVK